MADEERGWAVFVGDRDENELVAVTAESQDKAEEKAQEESDNEGIYHVDGPRINPEPGVWEFVFVTEHRERVVVEAPDGEYAEERADYNRNHRGEYVQTVHTEHRKVKDHA